MPKVVKLKEFKDWEKLKTEVLPESGLILFKYSPRCGVSLFIERQFDSWFSKIPLKTKIIAAKINVISERSLSRHIAGELNIVHQSPQAIWISKNGNIKWHASHSAIDLKVLSDELSS